MVYGKYNLFYTLTAFWDRAVSESKQLYCNILEDIKSTFL